MKNMDDFNIIIPGGLEDEEDGTSRLKQDRGDRSRCR